MASAEPRASPHVRAPWTAVVVVVVVSLVLGGLTSFGQLVLPDALRPLSNSSSGWTLLTAVVVWSTRRTGRITGALGSASFVALVIGYALVSNLRGYYFSPLFWGVVGVVAGVAVGTAAGWLRADGARLAAGAGLLAGIGLGEAYFGLTVVEATTGWVYWTSIGVAGLVVAVIAAVRLRSPRFVGVQLGTILVVAVALNVFYRALGGG